MNDAVARLIDSDSGLWGLFISALLSSTLLPGGSEALLAYMVNQSGHDPLLLLFIATIGNTLGAIITLIMGRLLAMGLHKKWQPTPRHQQGIQYIQRWGNPLLLFSWLPLLGDVLCLAAGLLRLPLLWSILFITVGKALRYYVIVILSA